MARILEQSAQAMRITRGWSCRAVVFGFFALGSASTTDSFIPPAQAAQPAIQAQFAFVSPIVSSRLSSKYGTRRHPILKFSRAHRGVDLAAPSKSHVRAVTNGTVVFAGRYAGYGKLVTIRHANGQVSLYGHLSEILVSPGRQVLSGEIIGRVGSTGHSTGPHLHFEWRVNGSPVDPLKVFPSLADFALG